MRALLALAAALAAAADEGKYLGCFQDKDILPDLDPETKVLPSMLTAAFCEAHCKIVGGRSYRFFGLKRGTECICGNSYGKHGPSESCGMDCAGGGSKPSVGGCGGQDAIAVYTTAGLEALMNRIPGEQKTDAVQPKPAVGELTWEEVGCFKDKSPGRQFDKDTQLDDEFMTYAMCAKHCKTLAAGHTFMALQDGNQCFCGKSKGDALGASTNCAKKCAGDAAKRCGGPFANQVFALKEKLPPSAGQAAALPAQQQPTGCGLPGAVWVAMLVILCTGMGSFGFYTANHRAYEMPRAPASCFAGALGGQLFVMWIGALLGHIVPDSSLFSTAAAHVVAAVLCAGAGVLQVHRSFVVAGREQEDRCEGYRLVQIEGEQKRDEPADVTEGPAAALEVLVAVVLAEWFSCAQVAATALASTVDFDAVMQGAVIAVVFTTCLACAASPKSVLFRNATALKLHFAAGALLFFLAINSTFELA